MIINSYNGNVSQIDRRLPLYTVTVGESKPQEAIHRPAGINDYQLLYTESGVGKVKIKDKDFEVQKGDVFILPPFTPHEYRPKDEEWNTLWLTYNGTAAKASFSFDADIRNCENFGSFYKKIARHICHDDWRRRTSSILYELLLCLLENDGIAQNVVTSGKSDINSAVQYIAEHCCETIELSTLAGISGVSEGHFCKIFKEYTHMRPIEYITALKIEYAKDLLLTPSRLSITDISRKLGFSSVSYFSKIFKEKVGLTPAEYRK